MKTFTKEMAETYALINKKAQEADIKNKAEKVIKYITAKYEKKIKKALDKNIECKSVTISLPITKYPRDEKVRVKINRIICDHFSSLGFLCEIEGSLCGCPLDIICNYNGFKIKLWWN